MAQLLNKDPAVYRKEADAFLSDLKGFHGGRGTAFQRTPKIGGRDVDLYLLYVLVTTRGGWEKVNDYNEWDTLAPLFGMPMACVNVGLALKQIYLRYLDHYEKVHFHGEELYGRHDDEMIMHDSTSRSSRRHNVRALNAVPMTYNSGQHVVSDSLRQSLGMSAPRQPTEYDRLLLSLLGPLPNEQDFAINLCTLLSNEGRHELRLSKHPRLMGALLAHAGVFTDGYTQKYMLENYSRAKRQNLVAFWRDSLSEKKLLRLLSVHYAPERRPQTGPGGRDPALLFSPARAELHHLSDSDSEEEPDAELDAEVAALSSTSSAADDDDELFCLGTQLGVLERTGHRVLQVAQVLRSLSFEPENAAVMAASAACLRFLLLCAHCRWGSLSSSARDTLGNIAGDVVLRDAASDRLGRLLVHYVARGVQQPDRSVVLASLEVLNKLAQNERNEEPLVSALDARIMQTVCTYLSLHDILLLISSLECLLGLTSLGEDTCRAVARAPGAVSMLVSLVTVEAQSYGPRACILMKVMQTPVSAAPAAVQAQPGQQQQQVVQQQQQQHAVVAQQHTVVTQNSQQQPQQQPAGTVRIQPHPQPQPAAAVQQQQQQQPIQPAPQQPVVRQVPMPIIQPSQPTVLPKCPSSQLSSALTENSLWTVKWLQTVCEVSAGQSIEQGVLYKQYTASAAAQHWKGIITQGEFANCVKSVFGSSVSAVARRLPSGVTEYHFEGIRSKLQIVTTVVQPPPAAVAPVVRPPQPAPVAVPAPPPPPPPPPQPQPQPQPQPAAPLTSILKAQLSAPPRPEVLRPKELPPVASQASSPRLSQALLGGPAPGREPPPPPPPSSASSSLIKSLLANKVAPPPPPPSPPPRQHPVVTSSSPAVGLSPSCFTTPQVQVARNMQNKRLAVNGVSENDPPAEQPAPDPSAAGDGAVHNGIKPSPPNSNSNSSNTGSGEGLLADLLERKIAPVNGIDKELRIGERGLELVNNNNGTGGGGGVGVGVGNNNNNTGSLGNTGGGGEQQAGTVNGGAPPVKRNGTDLLASALDMAGLMDDLGAMDDDEPPAISTPPPPQQPPAAAAAAAPTPPSPLPVAAPRTSPQPAVQQGFKRPAEGVAGGEAKRVPVAAQSPAPVQPVALQSAVAAGGQQVVMVPQSMANMVLKLPANVSQGQQLLLPQGQLMMTSSGQLVLGQHQAQVMVQGAGAGNVVVGQPAVGQPQTVLVAQTPQQQGTATRTLIFLPPHQKVYVSQPGVTHQGQLMVQVTRAGGQTQVVNSTVVTGSRAAQQHLRGQPQPIVSAQPAVAAAASAGRAVPSPQPPRPPPPQPQPPPPPPPQQQPQPQPALSAGVRSASPAPQLPAPAVVRAPSVAPTPESVVGRPLPPGLLCEWRGCLRGFPTAYAVYQHAVEAHCPAQLTDIPCLWERCDGMIRKRYSMMTHLQERHCPDMTLRMMRKRREQLQATGKTDIPTPSAPPPHPGYANNAALQAIRRHALTEAKPPPDEKEGPVTKSIRLTAALILRNIAVFSQHGRRVLRAHESHLLNIAASSAESSRTIGQLLADLHENDPS